jgi:hypothetical protein
MVNLLRLLPLVGLSLAGPDTRLNTLIRRAADEVPRSSKRGLVHITNSTFHKGLNIASDMNAWTSNKTDMTWYYNYVSYRTLTPNATYEFVPQVWGPGAVTAFLANMTALQSAGVPVQHVLGYNEPDGSSNGGSNVTPAAAAREWVQYMEPLRALFPDVRLGAPATTGTDAGVAWLNAFAARCGDNCTFDFVPFHWYDDAVNIAAHVAKLRANFSQPLWVTEYAPPFRQSDADTEQLFRDVTAFFDASPDIERYAYWPAFRSSQTPRGWNPDMAMLTADGKVSKVGAWYMGVSAAPSLRVPHAAWLVVVAACVWAFA